MQVHPLSVILGGVIVGTASLLVAADAPSEGNGPLTAEQGDILKYFSLVQLDDGQGGTVPAIRISGINLQIVNGEDATDTTNGLGNLIVGYNEPGENADRTGSHNIVGGVDSNYTSYGGLIAGLGNEISNAYCSVTGGQLNVASGLYSSVSGGDGNMATNTLASVSGGDGNVASGFISSVSGGRENVASGRSASVSGGRENVAQGIDSSATGGQGNRATGERSSVAGGDGNVAS